MLQVDAKAGPKGSECVAVCFHTFLIIFPYYSTAAYSNKFTNDDSNKNV